MTELKLQIREYIYPNEELPPSSRLNILELVAFLDRKASIRCKQHDSSKYKERMKKRLAEHFKQTLYGQIIQAINKAEYETRAYYFDCSSANKIKKAFEELRNSIPEITYD